MGWINFQFLKPEGLKDVEVLGPAPAEVKPTAKPTAAPTEEPPLEPTGGLTTDSSKNPTTTETPTCI